MDELGMLVSVLAALGAIFILYPYVIETAIFLQAVVVKIQKLAKRDPELSRAAHL
jgi:hypothetical protein